MKTVYVLLQKVLATDEVTVTEIHFTKEAAVKAMDFFLELYEEVRGYKIEEKTLFF